MDIFTKDKTYLTDKFYFLRRFLWQEHTQKEEINIDYST